MPEICEIMKIHMLLRVISCTVARPYAPAAYRLFRLYVLASILATTQRKFLLSVSNSPIICHTIYALND